MKTVDLAQEPKRTARDLTLFFILSSLLLACYAFGGFFGPFGKSFLNVGGWQLPAGRFILLYSVTWCFCISLFFLFPEQLSFKKKLLLIFTLSVCARLLLLYFEPSDDLNRYLWEGKLVAEGISPYRYAPDDALLSDYAKKFALHSKINHPDITAVYPPAVLFLFSWITWISCTPLAIKIAMVLFDMGALVILIELLKVRRINIRWALIYALNPLVLYSFAGEGHFDSLQVFLLLAAVWCFDRKKWLIMFLFAGLAVQTKYFAVIAVPFLLNRKNLKYSWLILFPIVLPYLFFVDHEWEYFFVGLIRFGEGFAVNGPFHGLFRAAIGKIEPATTLCKILFALAMIFALYKFSGWRKDVKAYDPVKGIFFVFGALILCLPTVHCWYLTWVLPFAILRNSMSWTVLTLTAGLYYVAKGILFHTGCWELPVYIQVYEWSAFFVFFGFEALFFLKRLKTARDYGAPETVSVVIPVVDEETRIAACIENIKKDRVVNEVIVVDGGSSDSTCSIALRAGADVIMNTAAPENGGGRGGQILKGINAAGSDIVAVVHADIDVRSFIFTEMVAILSQHPDVVGGAAGTVFDEASLKMKLIEVLNGIRTVFFGISFGDQIQFFRREPVAAMNLFPDMPLMEDVEFSIRMPRAGRCVYLFGNSLVSSRRWKKLGFGNFFTVIKYVSSYLFQRLWKKPDAVSMYRSYYKR